MKRRKFLKSIAGGLMINSLVFADYDTDQVEIQEKLAKHKKYYHIKCKLSWYEGEIDIEISDLPRFTFQMNYYDQRINKNEFMNNLDELISRYFIMHFYDQWNRFQALLALPFDTRFTYKFYSVLRNSSWIMTPYMMERNTRIITNDKECPDLILDKVGWQDKEINFLGI